MKSALTQDNLDRGNKPSPNPPVIEDNSTEDTLSSSTSSSNNSEREALKEAARELGPDQELSIDSFYFNVAVSVLSFLNLLCLGLEVDLRCQTDVCTTPNETWDFLAQGFTAIFVLEMIIRITIATPRRFFRGDRSRDIFKFDVLNCIDFFIVFLRVVDCWLLSPFGVISNLKFASAFRVFQFGRAVRQVQLHPNFRELWIVISAVGETMWTLFWVGIMVIGVIYICGILVSMAVIDKGQEDFNLERAEWDFQEYWGTVLRSSYSLFQVVTRDKWSDSLVWPLVERNPELMVVFLGFFTIASLSLMNAIIGVVVESTLASARANADREQKERERVDAMVLDSMKQIFEEADADQSGKLDQDELRASFCNGRVRDRLRLLHIPFKDLEMLFQILDDENSGQVNTNKFFRGVQRLRGQAAACHLHQMSIDLGRRLNWCDGHQQEVNDLNDHLAELVDTLDDMDGSVVRSDVDEKDPVLMTKRHREKFVKSEQLRGDNFKSGLQAQKPFNPWEDIKKKEMQQRKMERQGIKDDKAVKEELKKEKERKEWIAIQEAKQERAKRREARKNQPPPPPLPFHLQRVKEEQQKSKEKRRIDQLRRVAVEEKRNKLSLQP